MVVPADGGCHHPGMAITDQPALEDRTAEPRRTVWSRWQAIAIVVLLVAVTGAITYVVRYQPLVNQGGIFAAGTLTGDRSTFVRGGAGQVA